MPVHKRPRDRVKVIDGMIRAELPEHGHEYVAERLGEDPEYILRRAYYLRVCRKKKPASPKAKKLSKTELLRKRIQELEEQNKALRLELIRVVDKKRKTI